MFHYLGSSNRSGINYKELYKIKKIDFSFSIRVKNQTIPGSVPSCSGLQLSHLHCGFCRFPPFLILLVLVGDLKTAIILPFLNLWIKIYGTEYYVVYFAYPEISSCARWTERKNEFSSIAIKRCCIHAEHLCSINHPTSWRT